MKKFFQKFKKIITAAIILLCFPLVAAALIPSQVNQGGTGLNTITGIPYGTGTAPLSIVTIGSGLQFSGGTLSATNAGTVTSVSGTANRITSSGGATPAIDISASYVGQSSITTLGTIGTGVWNGTAIANANLANSTISGISLGSNLNALTATNTSLTFSGSYNGSTARTVGLNLGNANTWTGQQTFNTTAPIIGTITGSTQCLHVDTTGLISGTGSDCGSGSGSVSTVASADGSITVTGTTAIDLAVVKAPILTTARTIGGVSFNGSANITVATATGGFTVSGGNLAVGANDITMTGSLGTTGARLTKGWFTDLQVSNAIAGSITGNAATATALASGRTISISGDLTYTSPSFDGSGNVTAAGTLATVNSNVGSFGSATQSGTFTVNGKGLITAASNTTITPAVGSITGLGTGVATFLATPSSANLISAVTDETGSGALVFGTTPTLSTPVINGTITGTGQATAATASTITMRDSNGNITANNWLGGYTTTATAAGTTTLTVASTYLQYFTGTLTQTVALPAVSTLALGTQYVIVNNSTGAVTVNSSGGNAVTVLAGSTSTIVTSIATSGTTAAAWSSSYSAANVASGKKLTVSNTLTLAGTDSTTMTFPTTSATIARTDAANTFTGASTASAWVLTSPTITTSLVPTSDDGAALGDTTHNFSDLFLASGAVINYANGNVALTHTSGILTLGTGTLKITTPTNTSTSVVTIDGTQTLTNKSIAIGQITGLGTGVGTFLATPSSANLISAVTDETGTGALVFATSPTLVTPALGTPSSATLTNATGLPEGGLSLTDITTNDSSTSKHGFLKKLSNSASQYMDGTGAWSSPAGSAFPVQDVAIIGNSTQTVFSGQFFISDTSGTVLFTAYVNGTTVTILRLKKDASTSNYYITHSTTLTVSSGGLTGIAPAGTYLYVFCSVASTGAIRRYDQADLANVTTMTISGTNNILANNLVWGDGSNLYQYHGTTNFQKWTISGTTATNSGVDVSFTSVLNPLGAVSDGTNVWISNDNGSGTVAIRKYPIAGGAVTSTTSPIIYMNAYLNASSAGSAPALFLGSSSVLGIVWPFNYTSAAAITGYGLHLMGITLP